MYALVLLYYTKQPFQVKTVSALAWPRTNSATIPSSYLYYFHIGFWSSLKCSCCMHICVLTTLSN